MKLVVFSSNRADSGILEPLVKEMSTRQNIELKVLLTAAQLRQDDKKMSSEPFKFLELNDFHKIYLDNFDTTLENLSVILGDAHSEFLKYLDKEKPDAIVLLGDRMETLIIAVASTIANVPIIHLHGGEITQGALDELHRHAITKLSSLHFPIDKESRKRIISMGENPDLVFNFGSLRSDTLRSMNFLNMHQVGELLEIAIPEHFALITMHPALHDEPSTLIHLKELLRALDQRPEVFYIFTAPNGDPGSQEIREEIDSFLETHPKNSVFKETLGSEPYLSALTKCKVAIGNSSSLALEAQLLGTPTIVLGTRQLGRVHETQIVGADSNRILERLDLALKTQRIPPSQVQHRSVAKSIVDTILKLKPIPTRKVFYREYK